MTFRNESFNDQGKYGERPAEFFDFNSLTEGTMEEGARNFLRFHMKNGKSPIWQWAKTTIEKPSKVVCTRLKMHVMIANLHIRYEFYLFHGEYARK